MARVGTFDASQTALGWFDEGATADGWFDPEQIDAPSGGGGGPALSVVGSAVSAASVNLTALAFDDWAFWGTGATAAPTYRKATGGSTIGSASAPGGAISQFDGGPRTISWSDGTPGNASTDTTSYSTVGGVTSAIRMTVPATTSRRQVTVYTGWYNGNVHRVTATLSDGSASPVSVTLNGVNDGNDAAAWATIEYEAGSTGQTLQIDLTFDSVFGGDAGIQFQAIAWKAVASSETTLTATGIASAGALGSPTLSATVTAAGIASGAAFGVPTAGGAAASISGAGGIASAEAVGSPALAPSLTGSSIAGAEAFGSPTLTGAAATVSPTGIASAQAIGAPALAATLTPAGIGSGEAIGAPALVTQGSIAPTGIPTAEAFGSPALAVTLSPTGIESAQAIGAPVLRQTLGILTGIASAEAAGVPQIIVTLGAAGIASGATFGTPTLIGQATLAPAGIASGEAVGTPAIAADVVMTAIESTEAFGVPALSGSAAGLQVVGIASAEAFGVPQAFTTTETDWIYYTIPGERRLYTIAGERRTITLAGERRTWRMNRGD